MCNTRSRTIRMYSSLRRCLLILHVLMAFPSGSARLTGYATLVFLFLSTLPVYGQHLPDGATDWYLHRSDATELYVVEFGTASATEDPVVVLHGGWGAEQSYLWDALMPLASEHRFVLFDQRGSLRSPAPDSTISVQHMIADIEALRHELGHEQITIFAHSMGARLAYMYLDAHPNRVRRLALAGPVVPTGFDAVPQDTLDASGRAFLEWAERRQGPEIADEGLDRDTLSSRERTARWRIRFASGNIYHIERWRQLKGGRAFYNGDIPSLISQNTSDSLRANQFATLAASSVPVRVIIGDHDLADFGLVAWPAVAESLETVEVTALKQAGHNAWIDRPGRFRDALHRALLAPVADTRASRRAAEDRADE